MILGEWFFLNKRYFWYRNLDFFSVFFFHFFFKVTKSQREREAQGHLIIFCFSCVVSLYVGQDNVAYLSHYSPLSPFYYFSFFLD